MIQTEKHRRQFGISLLTASQILKRQIHGFITHKMAVLSATKKHCKHSKLLDMNLNKLVIR